LKETLGPYHFDFRVGTEMMGITAPGNIELNHELILSAWTVPVYLVPLRFPFNIFQWHYVVKIGFPFFYNIINKIFLLSTR